MKTLLDRGEVTITLPPGIDFRDPRQPDPFRPKAGDAAVDAGLGALGVLRNAYMSDAFGERYIPHDQLRQQSLQGQLGDLQMQGQQSAAGSPAHAVGVALDRLFRP